MRVRLFLIISDPRLGFCAGGPPVLPGQVCGASRMIHQAAGLLCQVRCGSEEFAAHHETTTCVGAVSPILTHPSQVGLYTNLLTLLRMSPKGLLTRISAVLCQCELTSLLCKVPVLPFTISCLCLHERSWFTAPRCGSIS